MNLKTLILFAGMTLVAMPSLSSAAEVDRMMITTATAKPIVQEASHAQLDNLPDVLGGIDYAEMTSMTSDEMQGIRGEGRIWNGVKKAGSYWVRGVKLFFPFIPKAH
ncbi:MAG: hypothetical protein D3915_08725 [Candidatus Electrothrix sp. AU1_5]|nr:hypothetical protein [Candidatus Electrothrix gigas]